MTLGEHIEHIISSNYGPSDGPNRNKHAPANAHYPPPPGVWPGKRPLPEGMHAPTAIKNARMDHPVRTQLDSMSGRGNPQYNLLTL